MEGSVEQLRKPLFFVLALEKKAGLLSFLLQRVFLFGLPDQPVSLGSTAVTIVPDPGLLST